MMHKALHLRVDIHIYVPIKEEKELACVDASIQGIEEYINKRAKKDLI